MGTVAVDLVLAIDNSPSMWSQATYLLADLEDIEGWSNMDLNVAITSVSVNPTAGWTSGVDPGEAGTWVGEPAVLNNMSSSEFLYTLRSTLACQLTCWDNDDEVLSDPTYSGTVGDCSMPDAGVTSEYLDCLCADAYTDPSLSWTTNNICYSGTEQHMESAALALCRAVDDPPDTCWDYLPTSQSPEEATGSNSGFLRSGVKTFVVVVSDAGDQSQRFPIGEDSTDEYMSLFDELGLDVTVVAMGPPYICDDDGQCTNDCASGSTTLNEIKRLMSAVDMSGGEYYYIAEPAGPCDDGIDSDEDGLNEDEDPDCVGDGSSGSTGGDNECFTADFEQNLTDLGKLLIDLQTAFELQSIPDESTIRVYVDDGPVPKATEPTEDGGYKSGWSYDPSFNAVVFWGKDIPAYNANVSIYYRPLDGTPRDFPL